MGASDLRDAFNSISQPAFNCTKATLHMEFAHDVESQILTFSGSAADGAAFEIRSDPVRSGADVNEAAKATAKILINRNPLP